MGPLDCAKLFEPFQSQNLTLKNRIVMAPMTRNFSPGGVPTQKVANYYTARADTGLIITEGTTINHPSANGYKDVPRFYGDDALEGWQRVVKQVHAAGGKIAPQLWHVGIVRRLGMEPDPQVPAYGPMGLEKKGQILIKAMTVQDIQIMVKAYAAAARSAKQLGFDALEIHGAHGYLIDQFLYEGINKRVDAYGGSIDNRCRFAREIVEAIREAVGDDFPIIFRFSQWKMSDHQAKLATTPQQLEKILTILSKAGVDIFHCSTRRFWEPAFSDSPLNLAGWTRKLVNKPTITVGSVGLTEDFVTTFKPDFEGDAGASSLEGLLQRLEAAEFDLVAVGRGLIANPDWVALVRQGRSENLRTYDKSMLQNLA